MASGRLLAVRCARLPPQTLQCRQQLAAKPSRQIVGRDSGVMRRPFSCSGAAVLASLQAIQSIAPGRLRMTESSDHGHCRWCGFPFSCAIRHAEAGLEVPLQGPCPGAAARFAAPLRRAFRAGWVERLGSLGVILPDTHVVIWWADGDRRSAGWWHWWLPHACRGRSTPILPSVSSWPRPASSASPYSEGPWP